MLLCSSLLQRIADAGEKTIFIERLFDEIEGADLDGGHRHIDVAMAGDQDDRPGKAACIEMTHEVEARHAGHAHIGDDTIELRRAIDSRQKFLRGIEA